MNLIEQLGGYERAKYEFEMIKEMKPVYPGEIETNNRLLLEYRRQHNIYEAGDDVVYVHSHFDSSIMTLRKVSASGLPQRVREHDNGVSIYDVRHATDAEIKAGKRLELNDGRI